VLKRIHCIVKGDVQGVGFRAFTQRQAVKLGLKGWVKNLYDGNVEIMAEGTEGGIETFLGLIRTGSRLSHVSELEMLECTSISEETFEDFSIRF